MTEELIGIRQCPKPVAFRYPEGMKTLGTVVKETRKLYKSRVIGDYCAVIQLIKRPNEEDTIRFGYYRKKPGATEFTWGSQTTYEFPVSFTRELIRMAEKEGIL